MFSVGWAMFWMGALGLGCTAAVSAMCAGAYKEDRGFGYFWKEHAFSKMMKKWAKPAIVLGFLLGTVGSLLPDQKQMAIIVGTGLTYEAVTSETGKRIGGKAIQLLEKQVDDALGEFSGEEKKEETKAQEPSSKVSAQAT
jgi:hypothetical protein